MHWEELTSVDFEKAVKKTKGVCLVPVGCVERHGDHLPLGTDYLFIKHACGLAAEIEPAVVFPHYYFGQINEAKYKPGTVALSHELLMQVLEECCEEISRNGFKKIILVNGHGGNTSFLRFFCQTCLEQEKDYVVFLSGIPPLSEKAKKLLKSSVFGHGDEMETSRFMQIAPHLVKMKNIKTNGKPKGKMRDFADKLYSGISWYSDYPEHYAGEAEPSSAEKGKVFLRERVEHIVKAIKLVKKNDAPAKLQKEFFTRTN